MVPADPTFPLLPIANLLCATGLLALLIVNYVRRSEAYNLAVNILSFSLFLETLFDGINMIVWADNADIKAVVYCDIGTQRSLCYCVLQMTDNGSSDTYPSVLLHCEAILHAIDHSTAVPHHDVKTFG